MVEVLVASQVTKRSCRTAFPLALQRLERVDCNGRRTRTIDAGTGYDRHVLKVGHLLPTKNPALGRVGFLYFGFMADGSSTIRLRLSRVRRYFYSGYTSASQCFRHLTGSLSIFLKLQFLSIATVMSHTIPWDISSLLQPRTPAFPQSISHTILLFLITSNV